MHKISIKSAGLLGAMLLAGTAFAAPPSTPLGQTGPSLIYVNDNSTTGDAYTNAAGSATGTGARNNPYLDIATALGNAPAGSTVYVDAGMYNVTTSMTIPDGVRLVGLCATSSTIVLGNNGNNVINLLSNTELSRFTITRIAPTVATGQTSVAVSTAPSGANMKINNCLFTKCRTAINVNGTTGSPSAIIENNDFNDNRTGIIINSPSVANLQITGNNVVNNRTFGILFASGTNFSNITISNNNITGNLASNVEVDGTAAANTITFQNNWVGTTNPIISSGTVNGGFTVDDHNTGTSYPNVNFMDNNGGAPPNYPNIISGSNSGALNLNSTSFAQSALPFALSSCCVVTTTDATGSNTPGGFLTIQDAVDNSNTGATITLCAATYNEQVLVNKSVTLQGTGTLQSVVNFTGTVAGKPTLFDVSAPNVTLKNISFKTDLSKLSSAITASGADLSNLAITNNSIAPYGSTATNLAPYGDRNAISINYAGYRVSGANTSGVNVSGNTISGLMSTATGAMGTARYFRSGVSADEAGGTFNGNTIQSVNHDVLVRFPNQGAVTISNNNFNGGGAEVSDVNAGAGTISVTGNTFDATFANVAAANTAVLRLKNNAAKTTVVSGNTFSNHEWAVSLENFNTVTLNNNEFTPLANSTTYHHVTINTKSISTNSNTISQVAVGATLTNNTFNGSGTAGGTAVGFYNHDNDNASFGTFVLGTAGNENNFAAGIAQAVFLDQQSGTSSPSTGAFPNYDAVLGTPSGAITTKAPWSAPIDASNNKFDVGNGLETPAAMSLANLYLLENKIQHKIDLGTLGFVTVKANNTYVTPASFIAPNTAASVQRGVDAASNGFTVNVDAGNYSGTITIDRSLTLKGAKFGTDPRPSVSSSRTIGGLGESILTAARNQTVLNINSDTVIIDGFEITQAGGTGAANTIVTNTNHSGVSITNNIVTNTTTSNAMRLLGGQDFLIQKNYLKDIPGEGIVLRNGNLVSPAPTNQRIKDNDITNQYGTAGGAIYTYGQTGMEVSGNKIAAKYQGIAIGADGPAYYFMQDINVHHNEITLEMAPTGSQDYGIIVNGLGNVININNNIITDISSNTGSKYALIKVGFDVLTAAQSNPQNLVISDNFLSRNVNENYLTVGANITNPITATCNWWNSTNAPTVAARITAPSGIVNYTPYRTDGTDTSAATGFQPGTPCAGACTITATAMATPTTCPPANGTVTATIGTAASVAPYTYSLNGGVPQSSPAASYTFTALAPGAYTVTVTDNTGCSVTTANATVITNGPVHNTTTGVNYCTIQEAVTAAAANNTITVDAGTYQENVTINTNGLTIKGANFNVAGAGTRTAESIVIPSGNTNALFIVKSNNVTIDGFTLNGDDPLVTGYPSESGADINAGILVSQVLSGNNLTISHNILKNTAIGVYGKAVPSNTPSLGNVISDNWFNEIGRYDYGYAVSIRDNYYANITNNKMTRVWTGVHINNHNGAGGPATFTMSGNEVRSYATGLAYWLSYNGATGLTATNNQFAAETGAVARNLGMQIQSIQNAVNPSFTNNTITGTDYGIALANVPTTATLTFGATNTITGTKMAGVLLTDSLFNTLGTSNLTIGQEASTININGMAITAASGAGVALNTVNAANTLQTINFGAATTLTNGATGLLVNGNHAAIGGNSINNVTFAGQTGNYIALFNGGLASGNLTATGASFDGKTGSTATLAENYAIEDKIQHKVDLGTLGFVTVKAANDFVTQNSGSIQRGIDAASNGFMVNVAAGTFNEAVTVNKEVVVSGAKAGVLAKGRTGAESILDPNTNSDNGFTITKDNVTIDGFTITNSTPVPASPERNGVLSISKAGTGNFNNLSVKNNIISKQFKGINFNFTDNFNISQNWLHGESGPNNYGSLWVASFGATSTTGTITNNDMDGYNSAVEIQGNGTQPVSNLTITENRSTGSQYVFFGMQGSTVSRNTVLNVGNKSHVFIGGGCNTSTFTENFFDGGLGNGVSISNTYGAGINATLTVNNNSITGHNAAGKYEVIVAPGSYTDSLMATCNWYGATNAATVAGKISGAVKYSPYLSSGTDNDATLAGFQPVPGSCTGNNNPPAITCPGNVTTCQSSTGNYTIPALMASDNCGSHNTTYAITGATARSGMGENASGAFNNGTSTIVYTVTDGCGNVASCSTTVMINASPVMVTAAPMFTVSGQEVQTIYLNYPSAGGNSGPITLSVPSAGAGATYSWTKSGCTGTTPMNLNTNSNQYVFNATAADAPQQASVTPDNIYRFTVTVTTSAGCFSTADKIVNVVNPLLTNGNYNVCHKSSGRGGTSSAVQQVPANQLSLHIAHGDVLGNCTEFKGLCTNLLARLAPEEQEVPTVETAVTTERTAVVYPNPTTTGVFVLNLSQITDEVVILITDIQGQVVARKTLTKDADLKTTFDLSGLANGMYLLQLRDGDYRYNTKVVVQQ